MEDTKKDAFLDASILIRLIEITATDKLINISTKDHNKKINLVNLDPEKDEQAKEIKGRGEELSKSCTNLSSMNLYTTDYIRKQVRCKGLLEELSHIIKDRYSEYAFIQIGSQFSRSLKEKAEKNIHLIFPYKGMLELMNSLLEDKETLYQPTQYYEPIMEFVGKINHSLKIKKEYHKYDSEVDQKIVACVLDNTLIKNRKSALISSDSDVKNILNVCMDTILLVKGLSSNLKEFEKNSPEIYRMSPAGALIPSQRDERLEDYLIRMGDEKQKIISGQISNYVVDLLENIKFC